MNNIPKCEECNKLISDKDVRFLVGETGGRTYCDICVLETLQRDSRQMALSMSAVYKTKELMRALEKHKVEVVEAVRWLG